MKYGFGRCDLTPRMGVELYGYSGYLNRYATAVRDRLWARAMAVSDGDRTIVLVSCDLVFVTAALTTAVRRIVHQACGITADAVMVHATHTHSGPCLPLAYRNAYDPPYTTLLPRRIAAACIDAVHSLEPAELRYARVPCEGMGTNRVYDRFSYGDAALADDFRPAKPELTDTECHVVSVHSRDRLLGFVSSFGCHNVVGGPGCTYVHGDYAGIATGMLEREHPGATGLFLQGAEGDVNSAICCLDNESVLPALDIMAARYARAIRYGLNRADALDANDLSAVRRDTVFSRKRLTLDDLRARLADEETVIQADDADDHDPKFRMAIVRSLALQSILCRMERGESFETPVEIQGLRVGPLALLGAPLEIFQAIKNDIKGQARSPIPLVLSVTNDEQGYAVDRVTADNPTDYAAQTVPLWKHTLPYRDIHGELAGALLDLEPALLGDNIHDDV